MYKMNQIKAPPGDFDYFQYTSMEVSSTSALSHNMNWSIMVGTNGNQQYASFSRLNLSLPGLSAEDKFSFPTYYSWTAGNFLSFIGGSPETKITYNGIVKKIGDTTTVSHYVNLQVNQSINRRTSVIIGARAGITDGNYYHIAPMLTLYNKKAAVQAYYNLFLRTTPNLPDIPQSIQFSFTYKFY